MFEFPLQMIYNDLRTCGCHLNDNLNDSDSNFLAAVLHWNVLIIIIVITQKHV